MQILTYGMKMDIIRKKCQLWFWKKTIKKQGKFLAERHPNVANEKVSSKEKYTELSKKINKKKKDLPELDLETKEEEGLENVKVVASKRESSKTIV